MGRDPTIRGVLVLTLLTCLSTPAPSAADDVKLLATSLSDAGLGGPAVHLLVPDGWVVEGGLSWRPETAMLVDVHLRIRDAARTRELQLLPKREYVWRFADDPAAPRPLASATHDQKPPFGDAVVYVERELVPTLHAPTAEIELVSREPLPALARVIAAASPGGAGHPDVSAARVRLKAREAERVWEEDVYCVLVQNRAPAGGEELVRWGTERVYVLRAGPGDLDDASALLETIASSYRIDPAWAARYRALRSALDARPGRGRIGKSELDAHLETARSIEVDPRDAAAHEAEALRARVNSVLAAHYGRTESFFDPRNEREVLLPRGFARAWANARGDYLMSGDAASDPRTADPAAQWAELHAVSAR
jgi:hypothetical protein